MTPNLWNNTYTLFLFDRQLIYCKKDLLKRTQYIYKGRIFLDNCRVLNLPDGKMFGVSLKNALRVYCDTRNKWLDFCFRSSSSKLRFLNTLSAERQFCGQHLFVSEIAGLDDDNIFDRDYAATDINPYCRVPVNEATTPNGTPIHGQSERGIDVENINSMNVNQRDKNMANSKSAESQKKYKKSDTLPKKSRKLQHNKEPTNTTTHEYYTNSLGRKKISNWFRKAKSTNTTPSQSPTHHPHNIVISNIEHQSDSSSQSQNSINSPTTIINNDQKQMNQSMEASASSNTDKTDKHNLSSNDSANTTVNL